MALKVIGAGFPRTGTTSLQRALELLDFGPCCHMWELMKPEHAWRWPMLSRAVDGKPVHWPTLYRGFQSTVDSPGCFFWRKLAHAFPEAKVILTVRDWHSWLLSTQRGARVGEAQASRNRIDPVMSATIGRMDAAAAREGGYSLPPPGAAREHLLREQFLRHPEIVKSEIAPERLLVFQVTEGWGPLCRFLGVDEPDVAFPHENDLGDFAKRVAGVVAASAAAS
ncbi:MAG TPA: sulfotransferase [Caulobacteraceae bacterium]